MAHTSFLNLAMHKPGTVVTMGYGVRAPFVSDSLASEQKNPYVGNCQYPYEKYRL